MDARDDVACSEPVDGLVVCARCGGILNEGDPRWTLFKGPLVGA